MVDASNIGDIIRWPILMIGKIIYFILDYIIPILIIGGALWFLYWIFSSGIVKRISEEIVKSKKKKRIRLLKNKLLELEVEND